MTDRAELSILAPYDEIGFRQMLAIYGEAIEPSEQKPADEIAQLVADPRNVIAVSRDVRGVSGFAMSFFPSEQSFWLLEYMAVRQDTRSRGIGRRLFLAAKQAAAMRRPGAPGVLEVDRPDAAATPGNDPARRLRLYRDLGCRRIEGLDYILPLESAGQPPPMLLLVHGLEGQGAIAKAVLGQWLTTIYAQVYRRSPNDQRIATMMAPLKEECALSAL